MSVSVVVVSFNTKEKLRRCLACVEPEHELIVVDNASRDGSVEMVQEEFPHVRLISNPDNRGFGAANNQGTAIAAGDWILYLNSDCYASPGAIAGLHRILERDGAVAGGGRLLNPDGSEQLSTARELTLWRVFLEQTFLERVLGPLGFGYWCRWHLEGVSEDEEGHQVEQVMGACLMVKRNLASFDERFFLYCEDTDLCKRLSEHGRLLYVSQFPFTHELGSSSSSNRWLSVARYNLGKELYFQFHHGTFARLFCWVLNRLGAFLRLILWLLVSIIRPSKRSQFVLFWHVVTAKSSELVPH